jgi:hypothetical protein
MLKAGLKQLLPDTAYERAALRWRAFRHSYRQWCWSVKTRYRLGLPDTLLHFGIGPGDDLLCTVVLHELRKRGNQKLWIMSKHPDLFGHNPDPERVVPIDDRYRELVGTFRRKWQPLEYARYDAGEDRSAPPQRHIIAELCRRAGIQGEITLRPHFYLQPEERTKSVWAGGMVAIQSSGLGGQWPMRNKQWFPERFQEVVNALKEKFEFVQLGAASDPALDGVRDLRGQTKVRESAAVLANCRLFLGNVGFLMHLARAVECPSVIIFGGREAPWQSGYTGNLNLYSAEPCAPCWLWNKCDHHHVCMDKISAADVIQAVENVAHRAGSPLTVDKFILQ